MNKLKNIKNKLKLLVNKTNKDSVIPIFFATDDNYVKTTAIAIMSVLLTNKDEEISFYILSQSLTEENKEILKSTGL